MLDHVAAVDDPGGAQLDRLADEAADAVGVTAGVVARPARVERQRLDHQRHRGAVALGAQTGDRLDAVAPQPRLPGHVEEVDDDARGVEPDCVPDRVVDHDGPGLLRRLGPVDVRRVGAQDERGLVTSGLALEQVGLADGQLDRVGRGVDERVDRGLHVLDPGEEPRLARKAVIDRDVEAAAGARMEQAVEAVLLHRAGDGMPRRMLIAGPNLTIDRTALLDELRPGAVLRFERVVVTPGGKGLNVARAARALGVEALLVGFVPGEIGRAGAGMIAREGIALRGVPCGGELRSTAVVMERDGRTTVLNEPGPEITAAEIAAHGVLVCSGSVPPGSPDDAYARLAAIAADATRGCVVDAAGVTLVRALAAGVDVVCPNLAEAEEALAAGDRVAATRSAAPVTTAVDARARAEGAAAALVGRGPRAALVTADAAGAALAMAGEAIVWLPAPHIERVRNPVGAGDVLASALAAALERGEPLPEAARRGVAAAAASVESPKAGDLDPARAAELLGAL